ncbi:Glycosyl transferase, family 10 [Ostreococcus tauri]|uniref:Fucosyltransferase n=1 Tax=Ostreococcus tauri TaxID=70448 RepID=A0A090MBD0_OSTTA|nr:Glycosyl transferase, family 10 [Ostreococcus tauri]CEG00894.1 Glycosyl transferase, family 10 [Ostreococcus tauri]|eukprot:XP_003074724.2 Glycosyl transferase, family 10 [Ostreococcus tauri]
MKSKRNSYQVRKVSCVFLLLSSVLVVYTFNLHSRRNYSPGFMTALHEETRFRVHLCGYQFKTFAAAVFPEADITKWHMNVTPACVHDVMIASLPCEPVSVNDYPGTVLFVDGENGRMQQLAHPNLYYLGVKHPPRKVAGHLQLFHVAHTTLFHPYSATDFLQVHSRLAENFLIYLNSNCVPFREKAYDSIVQLAVTHAMPTPAAAGKCHGNHAETSIYMNDRAGRILNVADKLSKYRFALVMENSNEEGYVSEKIANAFIAGTMPVYYGTTDIFSIFNKKRFIYFDVQHPEQALLQILALETNHTLLIETLKLPILADGENTLKRFFSLTEDVGGGQLKHKIRSLIHKE